MVKNSPPLLRLKGKGGVGYKIGRGGTQSYPDVLIIVQTTSFAVGLIAMVCNADKQEHTIAMQKFHI